MQYTRLYARGGEGFVGLKKKTRIIEGMLRHYLSASINYF
jgi:hypothetical protein